MNQYLTYDDIQLVPGYSEVASRKNIILRSKITKKWSLDIPIIASPMDTVCGYEMAKALMDIGAVGCIHRFLTVEEQSQIIKSLVKDKGDKSYPIMAAIGANGDYFERATELFASGANIILIDVAHGHHKNVKDAIAKIKGSIEVDVIAGNISTPEAAQDLINWGADALRAGIGGGSLCTTRIKTGFGVPNVTCLQEILNISTVPVIADGGIRTSGDIAKALALGSSTVMLGNLLAGTTEAPSKLINGYKQYRGAASLATKLANSQDPRNVEGETTNIPFKGSVKDVINDLIDGVKSSLSYAGANNLSEFKPKIIKITNAGIKEASPHLLG